MEYAVVGLGKRAAATSHHALGDVEEFLHGQIGESRRSALAERGDEIAREARAMDVDSHAYNGGRVEHRVDSCLRVVGHNQAAELQSGAQEAVTGIVPELDFRIVVL